MKRRHYMALMAVITVVLFVFTACSGNNGSSASKSTGGTAPATSSAAAATTSDNSVSGPKSGGILRIGTGQTQAVMGYTPKITANAATMFLRTTFDSLLFYDNNGNMIADLAEKWETDPTAKTITFHLRSGVKFSDGTDFNAEAVKWNIEQYQAAKRTETSNIDSIELP